MSRRRRKKEHKDIKKSDYKRRDQRGHLLGTSEKIPLLDHIPESSLIRHDSGIKSWRESVAVHKLRAANSRLLRDRRLLQAVSLVRGQSRPVARSSPKPRNRVVQEISENIREKVCSDRKNRREALFMFKIVGHGKGSGARRIRTPFSDIKC